MNRAPIKTVEQEHPWLWLVYAGVAAGSTIASYFFPGPWF